MRKLLSPPQDHALPRHMSSNLLEQERIRSSFDEVAGTARVKSRHKMLRLVVSGEDEHGYMREDSVFFEGPAGVNATQPRHFKIEQDQVRHELLSATKGGVAVTAGDGMIAGFL
jgi:hypothetical protein